MPERRMEILWPDGSSDLIYSPSTVIDRHFRAGDEIALPEFRDKARQALTAASQRVAQVWGHPCSRAAAEIQRIEALARSQPEGRVRVIGLV